MSILVNKDTRLLVQGITGREGEFHTKQMMEYGTNIVAGVTPGRAGLKVEHAGKSVPVFNTVDDAVKGTGADTTIIFVPAAFAADAIYEAIDAGIKGVVCIAEGIPTQDMLKVYRYLRASGASFGSAQENWMIGPNCPGLITPGECKAGIMAGDIFAPGSVGLVSRSGTLTYEIVAELTNAGIGQTTCVGIGGDPIIGLSFVDVLLHFQHDPATKAVVLIGEIGGNDEEMAAQFIGEKMTKPVIAFIAGKTAPPGKRMGHAGAIISGSSGSAQAKVEAFAKVGVKVADIPAQVPRLVDEACSTA